MNPPRWTRERVLYLLLQHGPLTRPELREVTGWSRSRLDRGLELAQRPRGSIVARHQLGTHRQVFYAKTPEQLRQLPASASRPWR